MNGKVKLMIMIIPCMCTMRMLKSMCSLLCVYGLGLCETESTIFLGFRVMWGVGLLGPNLGYWPFFLGYWDIAPLKLGYP